MPVTNATGSFNVGRDCQVVLMHPLAPSGRLDLPNVTGFEASQQTASVQVDRLDGVNLSAELPKGWTGEFTAERGSSGADDLFALIEFNWYAPAGLMLPGTLFQYITEVNGSQSRYQFNSVSLKFSKAGDWRGDASVKQTISFTAWRRQRV